MDAKGQFGLIYTEDFSAACAISYLRQKEVLQYFINKVSFYAFLGGEMEAVALVATRVVLDYRELEQTEIEPLKDRKQQRVAVRYISLLSELAENKYLSLIDKMKESALIMQDWETEVEAYADFPQAFYLDEDQFLVLSFDFNLLCKVNGLNVQQVLQHFINNISLATERAGKMENNQATDTCMVLFGLMKISSSMKASRLPEQEDIEKWYQAQLPELDEMLKLEKNRETRITLYRKFYLDWYVSLQRNLT